VAHPGPTPAAVEDEIEGTSHQRQNAAAESTGREGA
jgi:hypothetical protein